MSRRAFLLAVALLAGAPAVASAAPQQLVILRFAGKTMSEAVLDSATERAASAALRVAAGRLKVVTRDMLAAIVGEERLVKCETDARCELDLGTGLGTGYLLAGSMRGVEGRWEVSVKLYDVRKLDLLAQANAGAGSPHELLDRVEGLVADVMAQGRLGRAPSSRAPRDGSIDEPSSLELRAEAEEVVVSFESDPPGAVVRVDDQLLCNETPCRKRIAAGPHRASFEKERHAPAAQEFTAKKGAKVRATLASQYGWLSVETVPAGISVTIAGTEVGQSPIASREVAEGEVEVVVSDPCHLRTGERIAVKGGERRTVKLVAKPRLAGLRVEAEDEKGNVVDATVSVDGAPAGATGENLRVPVCGKRASVPLGNKTFQAELKLEEGKVAVIAAKLEPPPTVGGMVLLPGGTFKMGELQGYRPVVVLGNVKPFFVDVTEVTVAAYAQCVKAGRCSPAPATVEWSGLRDSERAAYSAGCNRDRADRANHPVNCVDFSQASAYCAWAGKRLPEEEEWEWAARDAEKGTAYPWGNEAPAARACWDGEGNDLGKGNRGSTCPVGSHPSGDSGAGVKDLAGNVWEWTSTVPVGASGYVLRGGGWYTDAAQKISASHRLWDGAARRDANLGFRCAKTP